MIRYVPTLKSKAGELIALKKLSEASNNFIMPFLIITKPEYDWENKKNKKTYEKHLKDISEKIANFYLCKNPCFIDFDFTTDELCSESHYAEYFFKQLDKFELEYIPVTGLDRLIDEQYQNCIKVVVSEKKLDIAIRLYKDDLELLDSNIKTLANLISFFELKLNKIHLIFDLGYISEEGLSEAKKLILNAKLKIKELENFKSVTVLSTGMHETMGEFKSEAVSTLFRTDYALWKQVKGTFKNKINFGDYGVTNHNATEVDPRIMTRSSRIKYTDENNWIVFKGHSQKKTLPSLQNPELAKKVISHTCYRGKEYSFGDDYIYRCSQKELSGNSTNWVTADTNQHIEFVVKQLST